MATDYDERSPGRPRPKPLVPNSSIARAEIPPPHLHASSQLYLQPNGTLLSEPLQNSNSDDHFGHFVSEHEIKFTRNEVCTPSTCICFFIAFLFSFMAIMSGIYYGLNFFDGKQVKERMFKVQFVVFDQDLPSANLENAESSEFKSLSWSLKRQIDALFKESALARPYIKSEIIAFERKPNKASEVVVHFNIHVTSTKRNVEASDIYLVLADEIANKRLKLLEKWNIEHNSLDVQERRWSPREKSTLLVNPWTYKSIFPGMLEGLSTEPTPAPRKCMPLGLHYCRFVSYNLTSYPNALNHWNLSSVEEDFITYKEIIDSECYALAREFLCTLLQPECVDDDIVLPCKSFCIEFYNACQRWLPDKVASKIVCSTFADSVPRANRKLAPCRGKPNCAASLRLQFQERKICDGIFDCQDKSDEMGCSYCRDDKHFHCGNQECVNSNSTCNSVKDCKNGRDEAECLTLQKSPDFADRVPKETARIDGNLMAVYKGRNSLVCSENELTNFSHTYNSNQMQILGLNICNEMHYEELIQIESKHVAVNGPFSKFVPGSTLISPYWSQCKNREIYYVECASAKCGISLPTGEEDGTGQHGTSKAFPGYWPWFAKINYNGNYFCDGTLLSADTVLAQLSCFTNERSLSSHNLSVTLASIRFHQDNIEAQRFAVSQVSPLPDTNSKMHLLRLSTASNATRYIRPVCHKTDIQSSTSNWTNSNLHCVLLSMNYESDQLQSQQVHIVATEKCHDQFNQTTGTLTKWTLEDREKNWERRWLCVQLSKSDWLATGRCANHVKSEDCSEYSNLGRHLFCQIKSFWHLFGVESPVTTKAESRPLFLLFETVAQISE